jgi:hypothetical protein
MKVTIAAGRKRVFLLFFLFFIWPLIEQRECIQNEAFMNESGGVDGKLEWKWISS